VTAGASSEYVLAPRVLALRRAPHRIETAAGERNLSVKAGLGVLQRVDFNYATHLPPILGGNTGGVDAHGLHIIGSNLWSEARRSIVDQRNAIDHVLGLIFRAPRMQHRVPLIEPSRLRIHEVLN